MFRGAGLLAPTILLALVAACAGQSAHALDRLGVSAQGNDSYLVHDPACDGTRTSEIQLLTLREGKSIRIDKLLWRVTTNRPRRLKSFVLGEVPDGFTTVVPLTESLPTTSRIAIAVKGTSGTIVIVRLSDVAPGRIFFQGENLTHTEFTQEARC
jgi:hypothetical protein